MCLLSFREVVFVGYMAKDVIIEAMGTECISKFENLECVEMVVLVDNDD